LPRSTFKTAWSTSAFPLANWSTKLWICFAPSTARLTLWRLRPARWKKSSFAPCRNEDALIQTVALIRDTFREAFARKIFWGLFGLSTAMILFFLFLLRIDIVEGAVATVTLFGRQVNRTGDVDRLVMGTYASIATFLYTWGMFLAVFASAGLIPSVLEPGRIELLLSKPVSRVHIL